ncbi:MAG: peptidase S10 [Planctomycetes bacterium]|nr:peptidase S10 [Planctomycetota bacterium]
MKTTIPLLLAIFCSLLPAQETPRDPAPGPVNRALPGGAERYEVQARSWRIADDEGKDKGEIFHVYYRLLGTETAGRPISFVFNGGPGSSSVWLHLGGLGPRRVPMGEDAVAPSPPGLLLDNVDNWLRFSDLVFIDPVDTGFSRPLEGVKGSEFHGLEEDTRWVGEFIRLFCSREQRWASPKYLVGESYGTARAASLAQHLQSSCDLYLNGLVLISPVLDFSTLRFDPGNDLPYLCFLPSYAAIARHHGRAGVDRPLESLLAEARDFARNDYLLALARGDTLAPEERGRIAARLATLTGIAAETWLAADLRLDQDRFRRELLRDEQASVGRMDGRFKGPECDGDGIRCEVDHSLTAITGPYASAIQHYFAAELGWKSDLQYRVLTGKVNPWSYAGFQNRYVNVADRLRKAMVVNPHLRVLVCCGYQDLATPFAAIEYTVDHLGLGAAGRERLRFEYFEAGHMMYVHEPSLTRLAAAAGRFYEDTRPRRR